MRLVTRIIPLFVVGILMAGIVMQSSVQANPFADFKLPEVKTPDWSTGQSATYNMSIDGVPEVGKMGMNLRVAIVGTENVEGKTFYWVEYNINNLTGLPPEVSGMFDSLKFKILVAYIPPEKMNEDPQALLMDLASGKLMRKLIYQINNDIPQMLDISTIQGMAQGITGQSLEEMLKQIPMDDVESEISENVKISTGQETVTVKGGTFTNAGFVQFSSQDEETAAEGKIHAHGTVPISGLVKMAMNFHEKAENVQMKVNMELIEYKMTGAQSMITGTPQPFDFSQLFGMMGGDMGY